MRRVVWYEPPFSATNVTEFDDEVVILLPEGLMTIEAWRWQ